MKSKNTAAFLSMFGGFFGLHRFYLKQPSLGIIYIILFWMAAYGGAFPWIAILILVDFFSFITMDKKKFDKKYNKGLSRQTYRQPRQRKRKQIHDDEYFERRHQVKQQRKAPVRQAAPQKDRINPFRKSGIKKFKDFEYEEAIEDFKKALEANPRDYASHFNIACAYSLTEKNDACLFHIARAVELGFKDFEKIKTHGALAYVRTQSTWDSFVENGYKLKGEIGLPEVEESGDLLEQLNKLAELRQKGYITEEEFQEHKIRLER